MYISDKFLQFSVNECLKFRHILKINTCIVLCLWQLKHCFYLSHTESQTETQIEILQFFGKIAKSNTRAIDTTLVHQI